jgi:hypothetical protein
VLLAHADTADRRLLRFDSEGSLIWERSYEEAITGFVRLVEQNGQIYLINNDTGPNNLLSVYAVGLEDAVISLIFSGGTRADEAGESWVVTAGNSLIISIGGGSMLALEPQ